MFWKRLAGPLAAAHLAVSALMAQRADVLNGLAAVVDDSVVTVDDVNGMSMQPLNAARRQSRSDEEFTRRRIQIWRESLDQLIERQLILHSFKTAGYNIPAKFFDDLVESEIKDRYGDRLTLVNTLHQNNETFESFRKNIIDTFIIRQMTLKNINEYLIISPKKIEQYYKENQEKFQIGDRGKIRVIVVEKGRHGAGEAAKIAAAARDRVAAGEDFAKVADELSDDARRNKGGDRGWVENKESDLRDELRKFVFAAKAGDLSPVIDTDGASFVVKVEERQNAHLRTLSETRDEIEQTLKARENERLRKKWIAKLRNKALIKLF